MNNTNLIFVYGTLKRGFNNHHILKNSPFVGNATIKGLLLDIGPFPGLIGQKASGKEPSFVIGEVYQANSGTLDRLDRLEGEGRLYHRRITTASLEDGEDIEVWTYYWGLETDCPVVEGGYWGWVKRR